MTGLTNILESIYSVVRTMTWVDFVDITLLSYVIYFVLKLIRETRAGQLFKGIAFLLVVYIIGKFIELKSITYILERIFDIGILAILIMFQPEVRRAVEKLGHSKLGLRMLLPVSSDEARDTWEKAIDEICIACEKMGSVCTGAIIAIERQTRLGEHVDDKKATFLNATPSEKLLRAIFFHNAPLHDGAVIIREGMILAAGCFFPMPQKEEFVDKELGSRHRAAIGMSENSDAIVIVVSEETGQISVADNGTLTRNFNYESLREYLTKRLIPQPVDKKEFLEKLGFPSARHQNHEQEEVNPEHEKNSES